jgi:hypothetical protein
VRWLAALGSLALAAAPSQPAPVLKRIASDEARQGVASDGRHVYAIDNSRIGKYRIADGKKLGEWRGDPALIPHLNSCTVVGRELVCASSNYPAVPQTSSVEVFDLTRLRHVRSHSFGIAEGSLTALDRHDGAWWAVFAHYDGRGGVPGKDNAYSQLVRLDGEFRPIARWTFPAPVLAAMKPYSASGASWTADGRLAVSGHDKPEIYVLALPQGGSVLRLLSTVAVASEGQAIDWEPNMSARLWTISRERRELVLSDLSGVLPKR